jgi:hypothetical protein
MSQALRALVAADQQRPGPSDIDRRRVYAALGASLGVLPVGAVVAAHAAGATGAASAASATSAGTAAVTTALGAASTVGRLALLVKAPLVGVGVGALLGATLTAYVVKGPAARWTARARRAAVTAVAPPRTMTVAPSEGPPVPMDVPVPVEAVAPTHPRHVAAAAPPVVKARVADDLRAEAPGVNAGSLAAEQALLDPARAALAHGDGTGALAGLALHERRFPKGALSQERDAMTIRALALTGDRARARARAESFRARYPGSLLWPMIAATLDAPLGSR